MPPPPKQLRTPSEQLWPFELGWIVGLREAGWAYRLIAAHFGHNLSVVCGTFPSHTRRPGSWRAA